MKNLHEESAGSWAGFFVRQRRIMGQLRKFFPTESGKKQSGSDPLSATGHAGEQVIFDLAKGDLLRRESLRRQPMIHIIEWASYLYDEVEQKHQFQASLHGVKTENKKRRRQGEQAQQNLVDRLSGLIPSQVQEKSGIQVERVKVSAEELARRRALMESQ